MSWENNLLGMRLEELTEDYMVVSDSKGKYKLEFIKYDGDCCGYSNIATKLYIDKSKKENPVITKVESNRLSDDGDWLDVTLFGHYKPFAEAEKLAVINFESSSGSGWAYGATITVRCKALNIEEDVTSW
jgi:hypothetical protein